MAERFDAIVVGAGHNGLTAGTYLARAGKKVLVLERMATPGGLSQSSHVIPEAPDHMIHTATAEIIYMRTSPVLHELELVKHGWKTIDVDPSYAYLDPDGRSIAIFRDPRRTAEDIAQFSKSDAKAYLELIELTDALLEFAGAMGKGDPAVNSIGRYIDLARVAVRNRRLRSKLNLVTNAPADQLAAEWFEHPAVRAFALSMAGLAGPTDVDGNGIAYALLSMLHRIGVGKAVGGMQMVANCFASAYAAAGGELRVNAPVRHILIERGKMRGVELEDGTVIEAPVVISTQDPTTAARMIGEEALDRVTLARMQYSPSNRSNVGQSLLNVATREPVLLKRHQSMRSDGADLNKAVGMIGTFDQLKRALVESRRGQVPRDIVLTVSPMSNWDPSLAPPGQG